MLILLYTDKYALSFKTEIGINFVRWSLNLILF